MVTQAPPPQKNSHAQEGATKRDDTTLTETIVQDISLQPGSQIYRYHPGFYHLHEQK